MMNAKLCRNDGSLIGYAPVEVDDETPLPEVLTVDFQSPPHAETTGVFKFQGTAKSKAANGDKLTVLEYHEVAASDHVILTSAPAPAPVIFEVDDDRTDEETFEVDPS